MLDREHLPQSFVDMVKRSLNVTWSDADTDARLIDMMLDAEMALNHKLGAEPDYSAPGAERRLYMTYMAYAWNQCLDEFDAAYRAEILQIRHRYSVTRRVAAHDLEEQVSDV